MKKTLAYITATVLFNTAIAGVSTMPLPDIPFRDEFICSQCIGLSVPGDRPERVAVGRSYAHLFRQM